jgi:transposase InsO family protein
MMILAHIHDQYRLSLQSYSRPRMTEELQELWLQVGHRRVGRLMRENGIKINRTQNIQRFGYSRLVATKICTPCTGWITAQPHAWQDALQACQHRI